MEFKLDKKIVIFLACILSLLIEGPLLAQNRNYTKGQLSILEKIVSTHFKNKEGLNTPTSSNKRKVEYLENFLNKEIVQMKELNKLAILRNGQRENIKVDSLILQVEALKHELEILKLTNINLKNQLVDCIQEKRSLLFNLDSLEDIEGSSRKKIQTLEQLIGDLKAGRQTKYYNVVRMPDREVVKGKIGLYFNIDFKNPYSEKILYFEEGLYYIDIFERSYQQSLTEFDKEVLKIIRKSTKEYEIFVRGSADYSSSNFSKHLNEYYNYKNITFLKKSSNQIQYEFNEHIENVTNPYNNSNLPNLRAQFIIDKMNKYDDIKFSKNKLHILDGTVTKRVNQEDRNVRIILYVKD